MVTDLPPYTVQCLPLDCVGTSDHVAVFTKRSPVRRVTLTYSGGGSLLTGKPSGMTWELNGRKYCVATLISKQSDSQSCSTSYSHVGCHTLHTTKPSDQPWFSPVEPILMPRIVPSVPTRVTQWPVTGVSTVKQPSEWGTLKSGLWNNGRQISGRSWEVDKWEQSATYYN